MLPVAHTWSLTAIAVATGVALLWLWKRLTNQERMALAKRQTRAQLYAMRLYADEPWLVWRAQGRLLLWTARRLAGAWRPTAAAVVPCFLLFLALDDVYGNRALAPGEAALVTARVKGEATLEGRGVVVETPGARLRGGDEVCWRVRGTADGSGSVVLRSSGVEIVKAVQCGRAWRTSSLEVACPAARLDVFGFGIGWPVWFLVVTSFTMLALRKRFGVVL